MVLFQFYGGYRGGRGGGVFSNFMYWLDYWGVREIILPFILIFTIFFAVLQKVQMFGEQSKKYNVVLSLAIALVTVIPHATGMYPSQYDIVSIINDAIPEVALLVLVVVLLLLMLGLGFGREAAGFAIGGWIAVVAAIILVLIFIGSLTTIPILSYIDPSIQALIVILLVFGLVVWFVTRGDEEDKRTWWEKAFTELPVPKPKPK